MPRSTAVATDGSIASGPWMAACTIATLVTMVVVGDIYANEPVYVGLAVGLVGYVIGSLVSRPTAPEVLRTWDDRLAGEARSTASPERVTS